ncbi:MAG TPA: DUF4292 domain-containing protein [Flavobacteriales bacterium]
MIGRPLVLAAASMLLLGACKSRRNTTLVQNDPTRDLPARSAERLIDSLMARRIADVEHYSAKADVDIDLPDGHKSFKALVRCRMDSAVWLSVVPALGIEVARALLTPDSVKVLDKLHDTYWIGDTAQAKLKFGLQPDLDLFQQALLGLPVGLDPNEKYRSDREAGQYTLTSKEKRRFVRAAEDLAPGDTLPNDRDMKERKLERTLRRAGRKDAVVYKYWIDPDRYTISAVLISDLARDQQAYVGYQERTDVNGHSLPARVALTLSDPTRKVTATLVLDRIALDGPLQLNFRIPEKFTPME